MGWFFSNLHVRKTAGLDSDGLRAALTEILSTQGYQMQNNPNEADLSFSIYDSDGKWVSVCSDGFDFFTEESIRDLCNPLSEKLSTDVLTISCFDSDCLLLNRINKRRDIAVWAKTGGYPGLKMRSAPAKWKDIVSDITQWKVALKQKHIFAEETLDDLEPLLGLASGQGSFCNELIEEQFKDGVQTLYYKLPESAAKTEPPVFLIHSANLMPCKIGEDEFYSAINTGGRSKGVAVAFSGKYVEKEEIRFRDVQLEYALDQYPRKTIPLQLVKIQTQTGQWIYYAELPDFPIREDVTEGLSWRRQIEEQEKREFGVRFTPEGNPRKVLDIIVHFIPLKNPEGQCSFFVWEYNESKREYIEEYNHRHKEFMKKHPHVGGGTLLNMDDYDLDE